MEQEKKNGRSSSANRAASAVFLLLLFCSIRSMLLFCFSQIVERNSLTKDKAAPAAMDSVLYLQAIT